jgi:hypothetical protein
VLNINNCYGGTHDVMMELTDSALISSGSASDNDDDDYDDESKSLEVPISRKRKYVDENYSWPKGSSADWKDACLKGKPSFDDLSLPSLEEATILFGFAK